MKMSWIKVKDKLPEPDQKILSSDGKDIHIAVYEFKELEHGPCDYSCPVKGKNIFWMPLPDVPMEYNP